VTLDLQGYERAVARALRSPDPAAAWAAATEDPAVPEEARAAMRAASADGVRVAALLIVRLRFERLMRGSDAAGDLFEKAPRLFTDAFKAYHAAVPPTGLLAQDEARQFEEWAAAAGLPLSRSEPR